MATNSIEPHVGGRLSSAWHRWTKTQAQAEADELQARVHGATHAGLTTIRACTPGETVTVSGMVRSMTIRPRSTVPALEIELYDGSGSISVIWMGRRRIRGIEPGRSMVVCGRLTCNTDSPTIYNPKYELKPKVG